MRRLIGPAAILAAMAMVIAGVFVVRGGGGARPISLTAHFSRTVGLYPGSSVRVLGVKVGTIRRITPEGRSVRVEMTVKNGVRVPADAGAVIIPPSLVSDRYVQLIPAYTSGPTIADGTDLPLSRTRTPVELDEILSSLNKLLTAVGPEGANADGSLARLVDVGAKTLGNGNGRRLNETLSAFADAITTLAEGRDDLGGVLENLSSFTQTLAANDGKVRALTGDLATVSEQLSGEREALEQSLKNLAIALGQIGDLVRSHRAELGADVETLAKVTRTVLARKQTLLEALDTAPLQLANIVETINTNRGLLDIRNNNDQDSYPYSIIVCQILAPILNIDCPPNPLPVGDAPVRQDAPATRSVPIIGAARQPSIDLRPFTLSAMFGGAR